MLEKVEADFRHGAWVVLAVALALRIIWAALIPAIPVSDGHAYDILAHNILEHGTYAWGAGQPTAYWPPGTSFLYAAVYSVFGNSHAPIVALNTVLSTLIVGLTIFIGRIFFDNTIALIAGFLMAISPSEVAYVTIFASELPFTVIVLLAVALWFGVRWPIFWRAIACGVASGLATYFRSIALLLPIVFWLTAIPNWRKLGNQLPSMFLAMIVAGIVIAPWSVRNSETFGHFVPLSTSDGSNLWIGNNPNATGFFMDLPSAATTLGEYEQNRGLGQQARRYIIAEPVSFVLRAIKKAALLHASETTSITWNMESIKKRFGENSVFPLRLVTQGFWTIVLLLALGGVAILIRRRGVMQTLCEPVVLIWIYFTAIYSVYFVADRYHFPCHAFLSILAAMSVRASADATNSTHLKRFFRLKR